MTVYKSRFTYFGQTGLALTLGLCVISGLISVIFRFNEIPSKDRWFLVYGSPFILFIVIFIWRKILIEINRIEITDSKIVFKNILTRKSQEFSKENLKGYKDSYKNGYMVLLLDHSDKVTAKIHEHYYKEFKGLIDNLGLRYVGRVPTFWDKIIKTETKE